MLQYIEKKIKLPDQKLHGGGVKSEALYVSAIFDHYTFQCSHSQLDY